MKLKDIPKENLELMPFDDIAYIILKEKGKKMKTTDLFKKICDLLDFSEKQYTEQIADFFTLLATEKRFIQLDKGYWDLRENHTAKVDIDTLYDDTEEEIIEDYIEEDEELEVEDIYSDTKDSEDDKGDDDDLKDFVIIEEDEVDDSL